MRSTIFTILLLAGLSIALAPPSFAQKNKTSEPQIRYCKAGKDINGVWHMVALFEEPAGELSKHKAKFPNQYVLFQKDSLFHQTAPKKAYGKTKAATKRMPKESGKDVWQYQVGEKGAIYFYKNQIFSHSVYCGKVTKSGGLYKKNSIILTPTALEGKKVYKTYSRIGANKKKKTKKKKGKNKKAKTAITKPTFN